MRSRTAQSWTLENKFKPFIEEFQRIINGIQRTENSWKFQDFETTDLRSKIGGRRVPRRTNARHLNCNQWVEVHRPDTQRQHHRHERVR